jgi:hypothetical protein
VCAGEAIEAIWGRRCGLFGGMVLIFIGFYFLRPALPGLRFY